MSTRIKTLLDLAEEYEESRVKENMHSNAARFKKLIDFVKLNFGSIEWEMDGFKRKILQHH
jgi:hypothetical protein